ncbi:hypothetical protein BB559_003575 [Furculomyces boomerangus]|uniref:Small ribosomal subunit protein mS33 n=2 Tax=Harpellales TaxID=61421 RepID=A0A2T9YKG0_9FUNG|nr:hypothetical protein BB559_003575 [Furculomyces boomerangus]PVZ98838.1 hypothetical protein BB558_005150 [Smittium angustum]
MASLHLRRLELAKISARIFNKTINPTFSRIGRKMLEQKPSSISIGNYYPTDEVYQSSKFRHFRNEFKDMAFKPVDFDEIDRLQANDALKRRGKGAPKKGNGKRSTKKK